MGTIQWFSNFHLIFPHDTVPHCGNTDLIAIQATMFWLQQGCWGSKYKSAINRHVTALSISEVDHLGFFSVDDWRVYCSQLKYITQKSEELASSNMEQKEKKKKKSGAAKGGRTSGEQETAVTESEDSNMA